MSSMFDQNSNGGAPSTPAPAKTAEEIFAEMVGEDKKYSTPQELAKAYLHADSHIARLEKENEEYRIKVEASKSVDEILAKLNPANAPQQQPQQATPESQAAVQPDVNELVQKALESKMAEQRAGTNKAQVTEALKNKFGPQAGAFFDAKQKELGIDLETLSAQSPQAVLALFGTASAPASSSPVGGDHHHSGTKEPLHGTRAYAQYMFDTGKINRSQKFEMLHEFAANPELMDSQRSYK